MSITELELTLISFRAAATRCREKRKIWVQQLEKKADDLSATNAHLQVHVQCRQCIQSVHHLVIAWVCS